MGTAGGLANTLDGRQKQTDQRSDDRYHDQKFYKGKAFGTL